MSAMKFGVKLRNISNLPVQETKNYLLEFAQLGIGGDASGGG